MKFLVVIFSLLSISLAQKLPFGFKRCSIKDNECLVEAVQEAIPKFKDGIKEFGIPPTDPLFIPEMSIGGGQQVIQLNQVYKNVSLKGLSNSKVTSFSFDMKDERILLYTTVDKLVISGHYTASGKILLLPVDGSGPFTIVLDQPVGTLLVDFAIHSKKGQKHLRANSAKLLFDVSHASYNFTNLLKRNRNIEQSLGKVLNENWKEIFDELVPFYTDAYAQALLQVVNRFFSRVPLSEVFLDYEYRQ
ncbi:protein takeout-like [Coccinella septempunctata]|uniref:protein takeout-like n=1 Tax=Coccinella septempunctata TaxID=41139 RepID=UPI001D06E54C|nr:protein takeout-like [Coccinella septempunctata]